MVFLRWFCLLPFLCVVAGVGFSFLLVCFFVGAFLFLMISGWLGICAVGVWHPARCGDAFWLLATWGWASLFGFCGCFYPMVLESEHGLFFIPAIFFYASPW